MVVAHNLSAMNTQRQFGIVDKSKAKSTEKLSSGYKINRAADDAAGLSISEKMRRQIRGLNQSKYNIEEGIGLCQTRDGALSEVQDMLHRMNELAIKSSNETLTSTDRSYIQAEVDNLTKEINRIGKTTTFNEIKIFDYENIVELPGQKAKVKENSALGTGYLTDAYKDASGKWHPSANLDFGGINAGNINDLAGKSFSFTCSASCNEAFKFTFANDGTASGIDLATQFGETTHTYTIDIKNCTSGAQVLDELFNTVVANMPAKTGSTPPAVTDPKNLAVSHSNIMVRTGDNTISLVSYKNFDTKKAAETEFLGSTDNYAAAKVSDIMDHLIATETVNVLPIQSSTEASRFIYITMDKMNAELLDVEPLDVSTPAAADSAVNKVKDALEIISKQRSNAGAEQNRLEHAYKINDNSQENTTAAESQIRDTDMATEMVKYSNFNILSQAGQSMMAQANQSNQGVLSLLQG